MKRRLFFAWLFSYSLILLIPVAGMIIAFNQSNKVIEDEISRSHWASLNQVRHIIDGELTDIDRLALEIGWSPLVETLMYRELPVNERDRYNVFQFHRNARVYVGVNRMVEDILLYLPRTDMVMTYQSMYRSLEEYSRLFMELSSHDRLKEIYARFNAGHIIPLEENSDPQTDYYWVRSFPTGQDDEMRAHLGLRLNRDALRRIMAENRWMPSAIIGIVDGGGHPVLLEPRSSLLDEEVLPLREESSLVTFNDESFMLSLIPSEKTDWSYFSLIPADLFLMRARQIRLTILLVTGAAYFITFFMLLFMTERNYRPIRTMAANLKWDDESGNELDLIHRSMTQLLQEQGLQSQTNFLYRLINGRIPDAVELEEGMEKFALDWDPCLLQTALVYVENLSDEESLSLSMEILINEVNEAFSDLAFYLIDQGREFTLLLVHKEGDERLRVSEAAAKLAASLSGKYGLAVAVAFSGVKESPELLSGAQQEAREALEAALFRGTREMIFYEDLKKEKRGAPLSTLELENLFLNAFRANQFDQARRLILNELDRIMSEKGDYWLNKTRVMGIVSLVIDAIGEIRGLLTRDYSGILEELTVCEALDNIRRNIEKLFGYLILDAEANREKGRDSLAGQTDRYIADHYDDINLTVGSIAAYMGVSDTYLSTSYKKETSRGLLKSIHNVRLGEAKKRLRTTDLTLSHIARQVGYVNDIALIRAFKRYEGISPGKYRESVKK